MKIENKFNDELAFLFEPMRYKVPYGGRGSGKSVGVAMALIQIADLVEIKVWCFREVQKSIKESVHSLLDSTIKKMGLSSNYHVLDNEIRNRKTGSKFIFSGLSDLTAENIKSLDDVDIAWGEEAKMLSKKSIDILKPTIRKEKTNIYKWHPDPDIARGDWDSEIWLTFNPDLDTDPVYESFVTNPPTNCISKLVNYRQNAFFTDLLEQERKDCLRLQPKDYPNIWEGKCRPAAEGAIYYDEMQQAQEDGRICNVPYDPKLLVHVVVDLGWNDAMSIIMVQRNGSELRVIDYIEDSHKKLTDYSQMLKERPYAWGKMIMPHDGYNESVNADSAVNIMRGLGWSIPNREELTEMNVENGIKSARMVFPRVYFDKTKADRLIECLKRYKRNVSSKTGEAGKPQHDEFSHGADAFRYTALAVELMTNGIKQQPINYTRQYLA